MTCKICGHAPLKNKSYEVIDVELGHVFVCDTRDQRDATLNAVELLGHRVIVREVIQ